MFQREGDPEHAAQLLGPREAGSGVHGPELSRHARQVHGPGRPVGGQSSGLPLAEAGRRLHGYRPRGRAGHGPAPHRGSAPHRRGHGSRRGHRRRLCFRGREPRAADSRRQSQGQRLRPVDPGQDRSVRLQVPQARLGAVSEKTRLNNDKSRAHEARFVFAGSSTMARIAFIGLGNMGGGMAANQAKAGHDVMAFDLSAAALERAVAAGCQAAGSAAEAVASAEVVITMLPAGPHVRAVYSDQIFKSAPKSALLIDCSTIDVESARAVAGEAAANGFRFADAPVSGGVMAAEAGTLAFMVGCEAVDFADVEMALAPMSRATIHAGEHGTGQAAKICNNMLLGVSMLGTCEAFALAEKLGLAADRFFEIASKSSGQCWSVTSYCPVPGVGPQTPADRGYEGGFATAMMLKDLKLAQDAAAKSGAATPMGAQAEALYALFAANGFGGKDFSAVIELMRGRLGALS
ncbi:3-hydroxyisobutyrate dehydrogenase [Caulobacter sp.]|uniref:3-hydroxyisobutyrate dehydrogenase n=1 Tax=Caulobacter sp. TaxID=78 RepID=UPI0031E1AD3A